MEIYVATSHFFHDVAEFLNPLGNIHVLKNTDEFKNVDADLVVFTGGADINPSRYTKTTDDKNNRWYNNERDSWELLIFNAIRTGELKTKKVVGFCRGLQLLTVGFGGTLVYDIFTTFKAPHNYEHGITHLKEHPLDYLVAVNSLHHQCMANPAGAEILSVNPVDGVPEIAQWDNRWLGFQFHPEFFEPDDERCIQIRTTIQDWILGKINFGKEN